jgi:WhiB family redox-sensing transcriptional regulator
MERTYMLERAAHARAVATAKGRRQGRPTVVNPTQLDYARRLRDEGATSPTSCKTGIARSSLYRHLPARPPESAHVEPMRRVNRAPATGSSRLRRCALDWRHAGLGSTTAVSISLTETSVATRDAARRWRTQVAYIGRLPAPINEVWEWQVHAACRGMSSSIFFHPWGDRGPSREERVHQAKQVCAQCRVIDSCLQHALTVQEQYGVWGGLAEEERLQLLKRRRRGSRRRTSSDVQTPMTTT